MEKGAARQPSWRLGREIALGIFALSGTLAAASACLLGSGRKAFAAISLNIMKTVAQTSYIERVELTGTLVSSSTRTQIPWPT